MRIGITAVAVFVASFGVAPVFAQHDGHDTGSAAPAVSAQLVTQCVESQQQALGLVDNVNTRLESARQSNSPAEIRAAIADLQRTLLDLRTILARCTELQQALAATPASSSMPGHDMSNMPGMNMPGQPGAPPSTSAAPRVGAAPQPAGHMVMVQTAFDPAKLVCTPRVDPKAAATATYGGKTYYFCSVKDRDEFLTDPKMSLSMMPPKQ